MVEAQRKVMEMERGEVKIVTTRRCAILSRATLLEKGIKIPDLERFMWTQTKQS